MHCIILAGGIAKPDDPLYAYTQSKPKALLDMGGRSMLEHVLDAILGSRHIDEVVVVGLPEDAAATEHLSLPRAVHWLPEQGGYVANLVGGTTYVLSHWPDTVSVLVSSADIPMITPAIVDDFIEQCRPWDKGIYYNFVTRETIEARFPDSNRTYSRISGREVGGGDMVILQAPGVARNQALIGALSNARKQPLQVAGVVGVGTLLKLLFRRLTFEDIERVAERLLGAPAKIIINPHAEIAMDADKPYQVDQLRAAIAKRAASAEV